MATASQSNIPLAQDVQRLMKKLSEDLYRAWREEIGQRLRDLEFQGEITKHDLSVPNSVWRLPNTEVRKALSKLQINLKDAGYSYEFRFQDVDDTNWILSYVIDLPEREESDEEDIADTVDTVDTIDIVNTVNTVETGDEPKMGARDSQSWWQQQEESEHNHIISDVSDG